MKKVVVLLVLAIASGTFYCKKEQPEQEQAVLVMKKYAKYPLAVKKELEMKNWVARLEKGEEVELLDEQEVIAEGGKKLMIAKIRLADKTEGYVESRHLADKVIVFIEETPAFVRPTSGSKVHIKVPKGTIGFVTDEQPKWVKIFVGKIGGVWVDNVWVQGGFSEDEEILLSARTYETALEQLASQKEDERKAGKQKLIELSKEEGMFAELASAKLEALESQAGE